MTKAPCTLSDSSSDDELIPYLGSTATHITPASMSSTTSAVSSRAPVTSDPVTPRVPVTPAPIIPWMPVTPAPITPKEPVTPAPVTPREPVTPAPVIPREPVTPVSSSLFVGTPDDDASIYIDDDLPVDASSPTAGDSIIILDNDNSNSPLDDFTGDGMKVVSKSDLTRLE